MLRELDSKIDVLLSKLKSQGEELAEMRTKIQALMGENTQKDLQISRLYEEIAQKDSAIEQISNKLNVFDH